MNELVKIVSEKTGISEDQARTAVMLVLNHIKPMLPAPFASELDRLTGQSVGTATAQTPSGQPADKSAENAADSAIAGLAGKFFKG